MVIKIYLVILILLQIVSLFTFRATSKQKPEEVAAIINDLGVFEYAELIIKTGKRTYITLVVEVIIGLIIVIFF